MKIEPATSFIFLLNNHAESFTMFFFLSDDIAINMSEIVAIFPERDIGADTYRIVITTKNGDAFKSDNKIESTDSPIFSEICNIVKEIEDAKNDPRN